MVFVKNLKVIFLEEEPLDLTVATPSAPKAPRAPKYTEKKTPGKIC